MHWRSIRAAKTARAGHEGAVSPMVTSCTKEAATRSGSSLRGHRRAGNRSLTLLRAAAVALPSSKAESAQPHARSGSTCSSSAPRDAEAGLATLCRSLPLEPANLRDGGEHHAARPADGPMGDGSGELSHGGRVFAERTRPSRAAADGGGRHSRGAPQRSRAALTAYQAAVDAEPDNTAGPRSHRARVAPSSASGPWPRMRRWRRWRCATAFVPRVIRALGDERRPSATNGTQLAPAMAASLGVRRLAPTLAQNLEIRVDDLVS